MQWNLKAVKEDYNKKRSRMSKEYAEYKADTVNYKILQNSAQGTQPRKSNKANWRIWNNGNENY